MLDLVMASIYHKGPENFRKWKISEKKFSEMNSLYLTSFLAWNFPNFLAHCDTKMMREVDLRIIKHQNMYKKE